MKSGNGLCSLTFPLDPEFLIVEKNDDRELQNYKEMVKEELETEAEHFAVF